MFGNSGFAGWRGTSLSLSLCALLATCPTALFAASDAPDAAAPATDATAKPTVSRAKAMSSNSTVNLINLLVEQGVLSEDKAQKIIKQAEDEAYVARQAARDANAKAGDATKVATAAAAAASPPGSRHVTYVPEIVKRQLREEIKKEVMTKAEKENWASPGAYPEWAQRIRFYGDLRLRHERDMFPAGNGPLENFNAINTGSPYDTSAGNPVGAPAYDSTADRERERLRVRLGVDVDIYDHFTGGLRLGTGDSSQPVSNNQTLGATGGNFSKDAIWLDRGFVKYQPIANAALTAGRFDNPFFSATDLVWYNDLALDGAVVQFHRDIRPDFAPFLVAGIFPTFNSDLNLGATTGSSAVVGTPSYSSTDKYMFAGQLGAVWRPAEHYTFTSAIAYYDFTNVQGQLSSPCDTTVQTSCSTDQLRPSFAQKGNTYMALRQIAVPANYTPGANIATPEYFGLASAFRPVVFSGRAVFSQFNPIDIIADGEFVVNTAFNKTAIAAIAMNNLSPGSTGSNGPFAGGNVGFMGRVTIGHEKLDKFGDWNASAGYKYLQSDAVIDAFVDPDFGLGGTNLKGYVLGGNFAFNHNVWATLKWMSATNITSVPYAVDVLQLDLNAKF